MSHLEKDTFLFKDFFIIMIKLFFCFVIRAGPFTAAKNLKASNSPQMFQVCIDITFKLQGQTVCARLEFSYQGKGFEMFSNH